MLVGQSISPGKRLLTLTKHKRCQSLIPFLSLNKYPSKLQKGYTTRLWNSFGLGSFSYSTHGPSFCHSGHTDTWHCKLASNEILSSRFLYFSISGYFHFLWELAIRVQAKVVIRIIQSKGSHVCVCRQRVCYIGVQTEGMLHW